MAHGELDLAGPSLRRLGMGVVLIVSAALVLTPVAAVVYGAFRTRSPGAPRAAFTLAKMTQAWGGVFTGGWTQAPAINTVLLAIPVTIVATALGVALAWAVTRTDMPGRRTLELLFLVPLLYSPLVSVIGWTVLADPTAGLLNQAWTGLTGAHAPLFDVYSYTGIAFVMVFYFAPYAFLLCAGAFRALDSTLEEAAAMSGAGLLRRLGFVTFPLMLAGIGAAALFIFTLALEQFAIPGFLGAHVHFETLAYAIFERTSTYPNDLPGAAAAGTLLLALSSIGLYAYRRLTRHAGRFVSVTARGYRAVPTSLGRNGVILTIICAALFAIGVALPLAAVLLRALLPVRTASVDLSALGFTNFTQLFAAGDFLLGLRNTGWLAFGAATICAALGLPGGAADRHPRHGVRRRDAVGLCPHPALPDAVDPAAGVHRALPRLRRSHGRRQHDADRSGAGGKCRDRRRHPAAQLPVRRPSVAETGHRLRLAAGLPYRDA